MGDPRWPPFTRSAPASQRKVLPQLRVFLRSQSLGLASRRDRITAAKKGADHEQYDSTQHGHYGFGIAWISHRADDGLGTRHRRPVAKHYRNPGSITANHFRRQHHSLHRIVRENARRSPGIDAPARG